MKALGLCMKAPEKLNLDAFICRYNVGKNGEQWCSFGQLLPVFKWICHEDSGSCCLVSNCSRKKYFFFYISKKISTEEDAQKSHKLISREINEGEWCSALWGLSIWRKIHTHILSLACAVIFPEAPYILLPNNKTWYSCGGVCCVC